MPLRPPHHRSGLSLGINPCLLTVEHGGEQLASLLADPGSPEEARAAALESLLALNDPRLDGALAQAVRDARLEGGDLLRKIEKLLRERKVRLTLP